MSEDTTSTIKRRATDNDKVKQQIKSWYKGGWTVKQLAKYFRTSLTKITEVLNEKEQTSL